jgi:hypothetical protein
MKFSRPHKMKAYPSFDAFFKDQTVPKQKILRALRRLVREVAPELTEAVKWGNGVWVAGAKPVLFAYCAADHVQFGFFAGAQLADPAGRLEGKGRFVRHVKIHEAPLMDDASLRDLVQRAVAHAAASF